MFNYDLDLSMNRANGTVTFDESGTITSSINGEVLLTLSADNMTELSVSGGVGCGFLYATMKDESEVLICRFTMSVLKAAGEFCKVVNYYINSKEFPKSEEKHKLVCEKCGRPFAEGISVCLFCYDQMGGSRALMLLKPFAPKMITGQPLPDFIPDSVLLFAFSAECSLTTTSNKTGTQCR